MNDDLSTPAAPPSVSKIRQGLRLFVAFTVIGLVVVLYRSSFSASMGIQPSP